MRRGQSVAERPENRRFWEFRNTAEGGDGVPELLIYGPISDYTWWGDEVTPKDFDDELRALGDIDKLNVRINSYGGSLFAGYAIYNTIRRHASDVTVYVDGIAASAASIIAMAGNKIVMPLGSYLMIHNPMEVLWGYYNAAELQKMAEDLDAVRDGMVGIYSQRTGKSREDVISLLDAETWMHADSAVENGFADEVEGSAPIEASLRGRTLVVNGVEFDVAKYGYRALPDSIKEEVKKNMPKGAKAEGEGEEPEVIETPAAGEELEDPAVEPEAVETPAEDPEAPVEGGEPETDPVAAERARVTALNALGRRCPGSEAVIDAAIAEGTDPGTVAQQLIESGAALCAGQLAARSGDASLVNGVSAEAADDEGTQRAGMVARVQGFLREIRGGE